MLHFMVLKVCLCLICSFQCEHLKSQNQVMQVIPSLLPSFSPSFLITFPPSFLPSLFYSFLPTFLPYSLSSSLPCFLIPFLPSLIMIQNFIFHGIKSLFLIIIKALIFSFHQCHY